MLKEKKQLYLLPVRKVPVASHLCCKFSARCNYQTHKQISGSVVCVNHVTANTDCVNVARQAQSQEWLNSAAFFSIEGSNTDSPLEGSKRGDVHSSHLVVTHVAAESSQVFMADCGIH